MLYQLLLEGVISVPVPVETSTSNMKPNPRRGWTNYQAVSAYFDLLFLTLMQNQPSNSSVIQKHASTSTKGKLQVTLEEDIW